MVVLSAAGKNEGVPLKEQQAFSLLRGFDLQPDEIELFRYHAKQAVADFVNLLALADLGCRPQPPVPAIPMLSANAPALFAHAKQSAERAEAVRIFAASFVRLARIGTAAEIDACVTRFERLLQHGPETDGAASNSDELLDAPLTSRSGSELRQLGRRGIKAPNS